jgi:hypothetical protein
MPRSDTQPFRQLLDARIVERPIADQAHRALHCRPRPFPRRRERRGLRSTSEARPKSILLGRRRRRVEGHISRFGWSHGAHGSAVDPHCSNTREEQAIVAPVPADSRTLAHGRIQSSGVSEDRRSPTPASHHLLQLLCRARSISGHHGAGLCVDDHREVDVCLCISWADGRAPDVSDRSPTRVDGRSDPKPAADRQARCAISCRERVQQSTSQDAPKRTNEQRLSAAISGDA